MATHKYKLDDLEYSAVFRVVDGHNIDLSKYFSKKKLEKMVPFEKGMYINKIKNFFIMKQLGKSVFFERIVASGLLALNGYTMV